MMSAAPIHSIKELTSLRFMAALAVLLSHLDFLGENSNAGVSSLYHMFLSQGFSGVSFFYVLSGFIISYAYHARLTNGSVSSLQYLLLRIARIAPMHWLATVAFIGWLLIVKHERPELGTWFLNVLLLQSWSPFPETYFSLNAPSWSLSNELFFYVAFIFLVKLPTRTLARLAAGAGLFIVVLATYFTFNEDLVRAREWVFYVNPLTRLLDFVVGMLLFRMRLERQSRRSGTFTELIVIALVPIAMWAFAVLDVPVAFRLQLAYLPIVAALVWTFSHGGGFVSRALRSRWLVLLGEASFSLYIIHRPIITFVHSLTVRYIGMEEDVLVAVLVAAACIVLSVVTFVKIERPLNQLLKEWIVQFTGKRTSAPSTAEPV